MIIEENTALITYINANYEENLEYDFLETLRNEAGYKGTVYVLDYGMSHDRAERIIIKHNVTVVSLHNTVSVFSSRYRDVVNLLDSLDQKVTNIFVADSGDIWFQKSINNIFELTYKGIGCVKENRIFGNDKWTGKCVNNLKNEHYIDFMQIVGGTNVRNSGVVCGRRDIIHSVFKNVYNDIIKCGYEFFGIDQLYFNYELCRLVNVEKIALDDIYNYVLVSHQEEYSIHTDEKVFDSENNEVVVVHNAGGNWRMLDRPFVNKNQNYDQYIIEKIYIIPATASII